MEKQIAIFLLREKTVFFLFTLIFMNNLEKTQKEHNYHNVCIATDVVTNFMSVDRKKTKLIKYLTFDLPVHQFSSIASNSN